MATANINISESKTEKDFAKITLTVTNDIASDIIEVTREAYTVEMLQTGYVKECEHRTKIYFELRCPEKIESLKNGLLKAFLKVNNHLN